MKKIRQQQHPTHPRHPLSSSCHLLQVHPHCAPPPTDINIPPRLRRSEQLMIPPAPRRILEPELKIPNQRRGGFVQLDECGVATWAGIVAKSELEPFICALVCAEWFGWRVWVGKMGSEGR